MLRGVVERVNWIAGTGVTDGTVDVTLPNGSSVAAAYLTSWPPIPRSIVWVSEAQAGAWLVLGAEGGGRPILHDDFLAGTTATGGDTNWTQLSSGSVTFGLQTAIQGTQGLMRVTVTTAAARAYGGYQKGSISPVTSDNAIYFAVRLGMAGLSVDHEARAGWIAGNLGDWATGALTLNPGPGVFVQMQGTLPGVPSAWDSTAAIFVQDDSGAGPGSAGRTQIGEIVAETMYVAEFVCVPGQFTAGWFDGQGPFNCPILPESSITAGTSAQVQFVVLSATTANRGVRVDWIHVEQPGPLVAPLISSNAAATALDSRDYGAAAVTVSTDAFDMADPSDPSDLAAGDG